MGNDVVDLRKTPRVDPGSLHGRAGDARVFRRVPSAGALEASDRRAARAAMGSMWASQGGHLQAGPHRSTPRLRLRSPASRRALRARRARFRPPSRASRSRRPIRRAAERFGGAVRASRSCETTAVRACDRPARRRRLGCGRDPSVRARSPADRRLRAKPCEDWLEQRSPAAWVSRRRGSRSAADVRSPPIELDQAPNSGSLSLSHQGPARSPLP